MTLAPADLLRELGPFFALEPVATPTGWVSLGDPAAVDVVGAEIDRVRLRMAGRARVHDVEARVAASSVHLTGASLLLGASLALVAHGAGVPDLRAGSAYVCTGTTGVRFGTDDGCRRAVQPRDHEAVRAAFEAYVLPGVAALTRAVEAVVGLGEAVTGSNAASALHNSVHAFRLVRPSLADSASPLVPALLDGTRLGHGGQLTADGGFRRRGCCLFYRLPGGGLCGDCVLVDGS